MNYGAVEAKSIAMFVDQMKAYSFRPMNPLEICAIFSIHVSILQYEYIVLGRTLF